MRAAPLLLHRQILHRSSQPLALAVSIDANDHWAVWTTLMLCAATGQGLERRTRIGRALSGPVLTMALAFILTNGGVLPEPTASFRLAQGAIVRLTTPLLLFSADLRLIASRTGRMLRCFWAGTLGSALGAMIGAALFRRSLLQIDGGLQCAAALAAKNIGSGINFIAVSSALAVPADTVAAALSVDNVGALVYFPALSLLGRPAAKPDGTAHAEADDRAPSAQAGALDAAPGALAVAMALTVLASRCGPAQAQLPLVTLLTVGMATLFPAQLAPLRTSAEWMGSLLLYLFFATAGAAGGIAPGMCTPLAGFTLVLYAVHLAVVLAAGRLFRWPREEVLVASSANIGGPATASSLARSKGWSQLVTPAILVGTLGNCVATFAGVGLHQLMRAMLLPRGG